LKKSILNSTFAFFISKIIGKYFENKLKQFKKDMISKKIEISFKKE
jgi:hypothetical protein